MEIRGNYCKMLVEEGGGRGGGRGRGRERIRGWGGGGREGVGEQINPFTIAALFTMFYAYKFGHRVCRGRRRVGGRNRDVVIFLLRIELKN